MLHMGNMRREMCSKELIKELVEELYDEGRSQREIADLLDMKKPTVAFEIAIIRMARREIMADVDPERVRRLYIDEGVTQEELAREVGVSKSQLNRFLTAHGIHRDAGHRIRLNKATPWNKGLTPETSPIYKRMSEERTGDGNPMAGREAWNRGLTKVTDARVAAIAAKNIGRTATDETREKMAAAKRGKMREASNRWQGGHMSNNYVVVGGGSTRQYLHREVAMELLGRELLPHEHVHHIDEDKTNNVPGNLLVLSRDDHTRLHRAMSIIPGFDQREWLAKSGITFIDLSLVKMAS
jgi:predicted XRE-type DNA-binding protein